MAKRPTAEQIAEEVVKTGATAEQGAASAVAITSLMQSTPDANDYLTELNNAIEVVYNDTHDNETIYDEFKRDVTAATVAALVYERTAPIDFSFDTDMSTLPDDEKCNMRKIPPVHAILKSINVKQRFKTTTSRLELSKIDTDMTTTAETITANLGADYADERTENFINVVNQIDSAKSGDVTSPMTSLQDVSDFIQKVKYYTFKFKEKRTDIYNAFTMPNQPTAKSDTKLQKSVRPVCFIDPKKLYKIEGDYYATLFQLQQALPEVDFKEVDGMTNDVFAILIDPRVIIWGVFNYELRSEQICGREAGELNHYLFSQEILGSFNCFNRMKFKVSTDGLRAAKKA